jgi:hypothetical protein
MKVWVYRWDDGEFKFWDSEKVYTQAKLIGAFDLDIQKEKRWVKKEVDVELADMVVSYDDKKMVSATWVPIKAKNFHLTYEVEE